MRVALPSGFSTSSPRCRPSRSAGRVRRDRPRRERHVELELGHQPGRHQGDQVRVAGDPRGPPREGLSRDRRAADPVQPLQDQHGEARPGEVGRSHQAVVAGADDRDVVPPEGGVGGRHTPNLVAVDLVSPCAAACDAVGGARNMQRSTIVEIGTVQPKEMGANARDHRRRPHRPAPPARARTRRPAPPRVAGDDGAVRLRGRGVPGAPRVRRHRPPAPRPVHHDGPDGRGGVRAGRGQGHARGTRTAASRPSPTSSTASSTTRTATVAAAPSRTATPSG